MTQPPDSGLRRRTIRIAAAAVVVTVTAAIVSIGSWPTARPPTGATGAPTNAAVTPGPTPTSGPTPTPGPTATRAAVVDCREEAGGLAAGLTHPACPAAILAVQLAVAPVALPVERIVIEPGPFFCDVIWPGAQSPVTCFGFVVRPGQYMHAWVRFVGSPKVAAVMLGLDLPSDDAPVATRPPWQTTLVTVEIPPTGWVMP